MFHSFHIKTSEIKHPQSRAKFQWIFDQLVLYLESVSSSVDQICGTIFIFAESDSNKRDALRLKAKAEGSGAVTTCTTSVRLKSVIYYVAVPAYLDSDFSRISTTVGVHLTGCGPRKVEFKGFFNFLFTFSIARFALLRQHDARFMKPFSS